MCTNAKEVNRKTRLNERILSVFCPLKTIFFATFYQELSPESLTTFFFPPQLLFHAWIVFSYMILPYLH